MEALFIVISSSLFCSTLLLLGAVLIGLKVCDDGKSTYGQRLGNLLSPKELPTTTCEKILGYLLYTSMLTFCAMIFTLFIGGIMYARQPKTVKMAQQTAHYTPLPTETPETPGYTSIPVQYVNAPQLTHVPEPTVQGYTSKQYTQLAPEITSSDLTKYGSPATSDYGKLPEPGQFGVEKPAF
jgi:hypothetical protein